MNALLDLLRQPLFDRIGWMLVHSTWQCAAIAAVLAVFVALARRSASARYLAGCVALLLCAAAPAITFAVLGSPLPLDPTPQAAPVVIMIDATTESPPATVPPQTSWEAALPWMAMAWLCGLAVLSLRHAGGWLVIRSLARRSTPITSRGELARWDHLLEKLCMHKIVRFAECSLVRVPAVVGFWKPVVLLPCSALCGLNPLHLDAMVAHELAHIRRNDYLANLVQTMLETLLFYHPAVWWISRQIRIERENCCDDAAVHAIGSRRAYGEALAAMETLRSGDIGIFALAANGGSLLQRIRRLMNPEPRRSSVVWPALLVSALVLVLAACAQTNPAESVAEKPAAPPAVEEAPPAPPAPPEAPIAPSKPAKAAIRSEPSEQARKRLAEIESDLVEAERRHSTGEKQARMYAADALRKELEAERAALRAMPATAPATPEELAQLKQRLAEVSAEYTRAQLAMIEAQSALGAEHPKLKQAQARVHEGRALYEAMIHEAMATAQRGPAEYYISGVPRSGSYSLSGDSPITLKQALISAGAAGTDKKHVAIVHQSSFKGSRSEQLTLADALGEKGDAIKLRPGDVIMLADQPLSSTTGDTKPEYVVGGDVPRAGAYSFSPGLTLLQALVRTGLNPPDVADASIKLVRTGLKAGSEDYETLRMSDVLAQRGNMLLKPGDQITVTRSPATQPAR